MNPVFVSHDGCVLDFEKPKTNPPSPTAQWIKNLRNQRVEVKADEESFDQMAARSAEQQSTTKKETK